jgi:hypothetical protein
MILALSICAACLTAGGLYTFMFSDFQDFVETVFIFFLGGSGNMYAFVFFGVPAVVGVLVYISLQHSFGTPVLPAAPPLSFN